MLRLRKFLPERAGVLWFSLAAGISIMGAVFTLLQAFFMAIIVNAVFINKSGVSDITLWLAVLLAVMTAKSAAQWGSELAIAEFAARVKTHVRAMVLHNLFVRGPVAVKTMQTGELAGLLTTGMDALETYLARYLPQLIVTAVVPVLVLMVIAPLDPVSGPRFLP
jgi:ATP-binding cassette subfamily C protein CydD